ncbi:uncharacterized protein LOC126840136 [Adelges cooleyi]|uniref:uncharacterized protein LOC126840136 n=1 Tax=Adelges cooleyi TaxID=133065 RepID=UPI00217F6347|nr:uncharacterized protein LOC126840136 [Adelges cooleyi]
MHFKNALTVCAVYILTSAWSIELDSAQLIKLNKLFEDHKMSTNEISEKTIAKVVEKTFRTEWKPLLVDFEYEKNQFDSTNLYNLLRALGQGNIKNSKDIKADGLTPFELDFFLEEFDTCLESYEHPKYINFQQLSESFKYWKTMKDALNRKIDEYKIEYGGNTHMPRRRFT